MAHRLDIGQILRLHDELDHAAAGLAAEAMKKLLIWRHAERRIPLRMERTQAPQPASLA